MLARRHCDLFVSDLIAAPAAASVQFASAAPTDKAIVIRGQGGISRTGTATLTSRVFDSFNRPLAGQAGSLLDHLA